MHLAMREAAAGTGAACFSDPPALNGLIPGSNYVGVCIWFSAGDPALRDMVMSGAVWARCLVPPRPRDSSAAAELTMAAVVTKADMAYRMQARELGHGPRGPTPLYLNATAVMHGAATGQVSRKMKHLATELAIA